MNAAARITQKVMASNQLTASMTDSVTGKL